MDTPARPLSRRQRRRGVAVAVIVLLTASWGIAVATGGGRAPDDGRSAALPPSIVLVLADDQRWDALWAMPTVQEALVRHGVTFVNAFVVNPLCCPSRASILTGKYSHSTGVYLNGGAYGGVTAFRDATTIATTLDARGYTTALVGKYLNGYDADARRAHPPPGWDHWLVFSGGTGYYDYRLANGRTTTRFGHGRADYSTSVLARAAVSFARTARRPFFLVLAPIAPHAPATPPPGYDTAFARFRWWRPPSFNEHDLSDKPAYVRALHPLTPAQVRRSVVFGRQQLEAALGIDDAVRGVLATLRQRHLLASTAILYTADNGVAWGEHPFVAARKVVPYEEPIRVPFVLRYDPLLRAQMSQDGRLVLNIDIAPTLAALAGTAMPGAEGRNLVPLLRHPTAAGWRRAFLVEHLSGPPQKAVPTYCAVRTERYKYVLYQTREEELYDLFVDPHEQRNLAGRAGRRELKSALRRKLDGLCRPRPPGFTALDARQPGDDSG